MGTNDHKKNDNCNLKGLEKFHLIKKLSETYFCISVLISNTTITLKQIPPFTYIFSLYIKRSSEKF